MVFHALSDPTRLDMVRGMLLDPLFNCSARYPNIPKSTRSHHLRILRESGLVLVEPVGTSQSVSIRREELDSRFPGLLDTITNTINPI
ncbi:helix-turn-helix transcriptional regulator [Paenibacillus sp. 32352]|uniref:ArsR/SmtB family transcription factor n=2 Tax=Paenibacillus vulneris TaxID=1133364 RepID=A0ABW3UT45_9BACL|nr:ArsR family transcriptional regulator [Paenibacillus sp. 32352]